mgnify:CR=1 FL=1|jgi:predicted  nucleic acid-binding Zn-ribbon protein
MTTLGIAQSIEILKRAQELDREIYRIRHELESIPETIQLLAAEFEKEKKEIARLEAGLKEVQLRQKQKEGELAEKESLVRKYDSQLTQVKTNKEYSVLQQEIANLKADGSMIEDVILGLLDEVEAAQKKLREEKERLVKAEKESQQKKVELTAHGETLKTEVSGMEKKRQEIISQVPPEVRELYEKIIEKKKGLALVPTEGEDCGGCRMEIRPQLLNELKLKEALVICENCSRILYAD